MKQKVIKAGNLKISNSLPQVFMAGPCIIENEKMLFETAKKLKAMFKNLGAGFIFKSSFDKANRTSVTAFRGPGIADGLKMLADLKKEIKVPFVVDVHEPWQAEPAAEIADILQVPAFLSRQTDLVKACAQTKRVVNIKKGQFLSPWDMQNIINKCIAFGNDNILLTERGNSFGYGNLVVDMRGLQIMKEFGYPVIFDCTHSVQKPGGLGTKTGGDSVYAPVLARAAAAVGIAGVFMEVHKNPKEALSDGPNSLTFEQAKKTVDSLVKIDSLVKRLIK